MSEAGCGNCHAIPGIPGAAGTIGPDLTTIGTQASTRRPNMDAATYIRESIVDPNSFIAPECPGGACPPGVMLQTFAQTLNPTELDTIVGYLAVLGTPDAIPLALSAVSAPLDISRTAETLTIPAVPTDGEQPDDAQIALGRYLFFDERLSGNNSLSCSSCHQPDRSFTDGRQLSLGFPSTAYFRNTPTLLNAARSDRLYRDGRMDGDDLPTLVRDHIAEAHFMSADGRLMVERINQVPRYVDLFVEVYGGEPSYGRVLNSIAAYVRELNSGESPYDLYLAGDKGAMSEDAIAGLELFEGAAGCSSCHSGPMLSDDSFANTGVGTDPAMLDDSERAATFRRFMRTLGMPNYRNLDTDVGLYALTFDDADWGSFRVPGLREVDSTDPYMHDGSLATLAEVVSFYNDGGGSGQTAGLPALGLNATEQEQLVAFLQALGSDLPEVEAPQLPPYGINALGAG
ncbi:MAG: photosynthetic protein synthase I [Acidimicrobiia bacterium]|nr:photosynthetic protein synthase I [Actinomycetota bacterium]MBL6925224.1 photosynthetic protein synthase I [Acidimicrobiia bacterium]